MSATTTISRHDPDPLPEGPWQRVIRQARDAYPDPVTITTTKYGHRTLKRTAANNHVRLDTRFANGTLTVRYIGTLTPW